MKPLHPALVHFPIAFVLLQAIIAWLYRYSEKLISKPVLLVGQTAASASILPAMLSGTWEEDKLTELSTLEQQAVNQHETAAYVMLFLGALLFIWLYLRNDRWKSTELTLFCTVQIINLALMLTTSHWGGNLVYLFGIGTSIR